MFKMQSTVIRTLGVLLILLLVQGTSVIAQDAPIVVVGRFATILSSPDKESDSLGRPPQARLIVTGITTDEEFYRADIDGGIAWIFQGEALEIEGDLSAVPRLDPGDANDIPVFTPETEVSLYDSPNEDAKIVLDVENEALYILAMSEMEDFYLVLYQGQLAWLAIEAVEDNGKVEGDLEDIPILSNAPEPCFVSTDKAQTVRLRVGYGENRTSVTFLAANTEFTVQGQNEDAEGRVWYALAKEDAAPTKSLIDPYVWLLASDVIETGDCDVHEIVETSGPRPPANLPPTNDEPATEGANSITVVVSSQVVWVDTSISLAAGQSFSVSATGLANLCGTSDNPNCIDDPAVNRQIGPEGNLGWERCEGQYAPCQLMPGIYGALVGRVGGGSSFHIGTGGNFVANADGALQLGFNDHKFWDNTGSYTVTINVK